jgi:hypothetical protein
VRGADRLKVVRSAILWVFEVLVFTANLAVGFQSGRYSHAGQDDRLEDHPDSDENKQTQKFHIVAPLLSRRRLTAGTEIQPQENPPDPEQPKDDSPAEADRAKGDMTRSSRSHSQFGHTTSSSDRKTNTSNRPPQSRHTYS